MKRSIRSALRAAFGLVLAVAAGLALAQDLSAARAKTTDANNFLYMSKANQLFSVDPKRIRPKGLFVPVTSDLIFPPVMSRRAADTLRKQGNAVDYFEIPTDGGHIDGVTQIGLAAKPIAEFLAR